MDYRSIARQFLRENYPYHFQLWIGMKTHDETSFAVIGYFMNNWANIKSIAVGETKEELKQNILRETYDFPITEEEYDEKIIVHEYTIVKKTYSATYYIGLYGSGYDTKSLIDKVAELCYNNNQ